MKKEKEILSAWIVEKEILSAWIVEKVDLETLEIVYVVYQQDRQKSEPNRITKCGVYKKIEEAQTAMEIVSRYPILEK